MKNPKIMQILPADGWWVVHYHQGKSIQQDERVAFWALFDDGSVAGLVGGHERLAPATDCKDWKYEYRR